MHRLDYMSSTIKAEIPVDSDLFYVVYYGKENVSVPSKWGRKIRGVLEKQIKSPESEIVYYQC